MLSLFAVCLIYYKGKPPNVGVTGGHVILLSSDITCTVDHVIQLPANGRGCKLACMQHQDGGCVAL